MAIVIAKVIAERLVQMQAFCVRVPVRMTDWDSSTSKYGSRSERSKNANMNLDVLIDGTKYTASISMPWCARCGSHNAYLVMLMSCCDALSIPLKVKGTGTWHARQC